MSRGEDRPVRTVTRPSIPPLAWVAAALWVSVALTGSLIQRPAVESWMLHVCGAILLILGAGLVVTVSTSVPGVSLRLTGVMLASAGIGVVVSAAFFGNVLDATYKIDGQVGDWHGVAVGDPRESGGQRRIEVRLAEGPGAGHTVVVAWEETSGQTPSLGERVSFRGRLEQPGDHELAHADTKRDIIARGEAWSAEIEGWRSGPLGAIGRLRASARDRLGRIDGDGGAILSGILIGDRERLRGSQAETDLRAAGLAHVLAVSGTHLAIVLGCAAAVGKAWGGTRRTVVMCALLAGATYVLLSGVQISAVRAFGVAVVASIAGGAGRRGDPLAALALVVSAALLWDPTTAFSVGFSLSVAATGALVLVGPLVGLWLSAATFTPLQGITGALAATLVATLATSPIVAAVFGSVSVVGPLANLLCVPLVSLALGIGMVGLILSWPLPVVGIALIEVAAGVLEAVCKVSAWLVSIAGANVPILGGPILVLMAAGALVALWAIWPQPSSDRKPRATVAALGVLLCIPLLLPGARETRIVFLDIGQGDAALIQDSGRTILVDTGPDPFVLRQALARAGVRRLDAVLITHGHDDHYGGIDALRGVVASGRIYCSAVMEIPDDEPMLAEAQPLSRGDSFRVGGTTVDVIWPTENHIPAEENEASLVLHARHGDLDVLLTGDAEEPVYSMSAKAGLLPQVEVLKVPHHGSSDGMDPESLQVVSPSVAVVSVGEGNRFGHPTQSTLDLLHSAGATVIRTDESGDVTIVIDDGGTRFEVLRQKEETHLGRGGTVSPCATIRHADGSQMSAAKFTFPPWKAVGQLDGRPERPQTCLPDSRTRGTVAQAGLRASKEPPCRSSRSRLQLRHVRGRACHRCRDHLGSQHASVHVRAPPGGGA